MTSTARLVLIGVAIGALIGAVVITVSDEIAARRSERAVKATFGNVRRVS